MDKASFVIVKGAAVRTTCPVGDSPRNPQNYLERVRVSFEHSPSPSDTMSDHDVASENWVEEGGEGGQMQLIMAPTPLWVLGLTHRSDCSHLLSLECNYYTELDTLLLL